jgi:hypothetical protein
MSQRRRALQRVMLSPGKIGDIAKDDMHQVGVSG